MDKHTLEQHILAGRTDFQGVNLVDRDLTMARLEGINLQGAKLEGIDLQGANLRGANLEDADLEDANLQRVNLQEAKLKGAFLQDATAHGANFARANLYDAFFWRAGCNRANFQGANLRAANFMDTDLYRTDFQSANLYRTDFRGANLKDALWIGANTEEAIFSRGSGPTERSNEMSKSEPVASWEFRSVKERFDGKRILREAEEAGAQLVEIERGDDTLIYASRVYCRRLIDAKLIIIYVPCNFPQATQKGLLRVGKTIAMDSYCDLKDWDWVAVRRVKHPEKEVYFISGAKIHAELLRAEAERLCTTVTCWE